MSNISRTGRPKGLEQLPSNPTTQSSQPKAGELSSQATRDVFQKVTGGVLGYKSNQMMSGAIRLLSSDNVILPKSLTDPNNPANDLKYLRLISAALGREDLEKHFYSIEGEEQEEYLAQKAKQRKEKWAKIEEEKQRESDAKQEEREQKEEEEKDEDEQE